MPQRQDVQTSSDCTIRDASGRPMLHPLATIFSRSRATRLVPRWDLLTKHLALDAEFQWVWEGGYLTERIGRISIVNYDGQVIYDVFVCFEEEEGQTIDLPPASRHLGVYWRDIKPANAAVPIEEALENLSQIIEDHYIVGHSIENDIKVFRASGGGELLKYAAGYRDTQKHRGYQQIMGKPQPKLKTLSERMLGKGIQGKDHSSVEDAQATMELYRLRESEIEAEQAGWVHWLARPITEQDILDHEDYMTHGTIYAKEYDPYEDDYYVPPPAATTDISPVTPSASVPLVCGPITRAASQWQAFINNDRARSSKVATPASAAQSTSRSNRDDKPPSAATATCLVPQSLEGSLLSGNVTTSEYSDQSRGASPASLATQDTNLTSHSELSSTHKSSPKYRYIKAEAPSNTVTDSHRHAKALFSIKVAYPLSPPTAKVTVGYGNKPSRHVGLLSCRKLQCI